MSETIFQLVAILCVVGFIAGILSGLLGVGGGIVLVPAYFYTFSSIGYDSPHLMQICVATSLATIISTSLRSVSSHNKRGSVDWELLKKWAPFIGVGAVIGVGAAMKLHSNSLQLVFGFIGLFIGLYMGFGKASWRLADQMPTGIRRAVSGGLIGFLSALMGIGGGSFAVPLMTLHGRPIHNAVATASGFGAIIAIPSALVFLLVNIPESHQVPLTIGAVNIPAFILTILLTTISAPLGARLAHSLDPKPLKRIFALFLVAVALNMLRKTLIG